MIWTEAHSTVWGLESDYIHFFGGMGWLLSGGLALFISSPRKAPLINHSLSRVWLPAAIAFFLLAVANAAALVGAYGHLLPNCEHCFDLSTAAAGGAIAVVLATLPVPGASQPRWVWRMARALVATCFGVILFFVHPGLPWWTLVAGTAGGLLLVIFPRWLHNEPSSNCRLARRLVGIALMSAAWGWGGAVLAAGAAWPMTEAAVAEAITPQRTLPLALLAWFVFVALWIVHLRIELVPRVRARRGFFGLRPALLLPALQLAVLGGGYFFTASNRSEAEYYVGRRIVAEVQAVIVSSRLQVPAIFDFETAAVAPNAWRQPREQLARLLASSKSYLAAVYWSNGADGPRIIAASQSAIPGAPFDSMRLVNLGAKLRAIVESGEPVVQWLAGPERYSSAVVTFARSPDRAAGWPPGSFLSVELDARGRADLIAAHLLQALAIISLVSLLVGIAVVYTVHSLNEAELVAAKEVAEAESRAKSDLLAMVSHEVRTPLQSVLGYAELAESEAPKRDVSRYLRAIRTQGEMLLRIVQDILDFSAARREGLLLHIEAVALREVLAEVQAACAERAQGKGLGCSIEVAEDVPEYVATDRVRLLQVLLNLVRNAVKFTDRGHIHASLARRPRPEAETKGLVELEFSVSDTGPGIPQSELRRLFEPFGKCRLDDTPGAGGVGLGLAICRQIVQRLGGEISVQSTVGQGTTFQIVLTLPVMKQPAAEELVRETSVPAPPSAPALSGLTVLLVDDNPYVRELIREFLHRLGAEVCARPDGRSALEAAHTRRFDVVMLDLRLPDMHGRALAARIRKLGRSEREPWIVGFSAGISDAQIQQLLDDDLNDFMLKPVSIEGLAETIRLSPAGSKIRGKIDDAAVEEPGRVLREKFLEEARAILDRLEVLRENRKLPQIAAEAHYLANSCLVFGFLEAFQVCGELEQMAGRDICDGLDGRLRALRTALEAADVSAG